MTLLLRTITSYPKGKLSEELIYLLDLGLIVKASKFQIEVDIIKSEYKCGC